MDQSTTTTIIALAGLEQPLAALTLPSDPVGTPPLMQLPTKKRTKKQTLLAID